MSHYNPDVADIETAAKNLECVAIRTPLVRNARLSDLYHAQVFIKREDLQVVRSFKIRGAYNKMVGLSDSERMRGVVCASAGNHSQGVAFACAKLAIDGTIFMPATTPPQKIFQTQKYGRGYVNIVLSGNNFDEALCAAVVHEKKHQSILVHPFDDPKVIEGQATVAKEIFEDSKTPVDYLLFPLGGGGLAAGVSSYFKQLSKETQLIGVEPAGAAAMKQSLAAGINITLTDIDTFSDGAAVKRVGDRGFHICQQTLDRIIAVPEGKICSEILKLYNDDAIIAEPAGALSIAALDELKDEIRGKHVVCVLSGGNNDIGRIEEIKTRSWLFEGRDILSDAPLHQNRRSNLLPIMANV
jgi:threonine dehydratase